MKNSDAHRPDALAADDLLETALRLMETNAEAALAHLGALLEHYPNDPRLHFMNGSVLAGLERYGEARGAMQRAVDIAPDYDLARFQLGFLALTSGDTQGALSMWRPLRDLPLTNPLVLFVQGLDAMLADHFEESIALLEAGARENRQLPPLNQNMAILVNEMRERLKQKGGDEAVESGAHFLLRQYSFKDTRH